MKRALILPALLLLAACGDSPEVHYAKAQTAFAAHDFAEARIHLNAILADKPDDRNAMLLQARTLVAMGEGDAARVLLEKLAGGQPPQGEVAELSAQAALLRRLPDVAVQMLQGVETAEAYRLRSIAAMQKQNLDAAETAIAKAAELGGSAQIFADYARLLLIKGDIPAATQMAAKAKQAGPNELGTLLIDGELAIRRGDLALALADYEKADKLFPQNIAAMSGKASVLGELGRMEELDAALKPLIATVPNDPTVTYLRAKVALSHQDWKGVRAMVEPLESALPKQDPLRLVYAEALLHSDQAEQAIAQVGPTARANPGNRYAVRLLAESQLAAGDGRAAMATLRPNATGPLARPEEVALLAKIARANEDPEADALEARAKQPMPQALGSDLADADAAMRAGNWARAVASYDRIQAMTDGKNVMVLNNLAYAHAMLGNHDRAIANAGKALALAPDNASVLDTAGWVRVKAGKDHAEALRLLRLAAGKAPANASIKQHLAEAERMPG